MNKTRDSQIGDKALSKSEFSTFIQQLQQTTERLMNEVFNLPNFETTSNQNMTPAVSKKNLQTPAQTILYQNKHRPNKQQITFNFLKRTQQFEVLRKSKIEHQKQLKQQNFLKSHPRKPVLNNSNIEIEPIQQRCLQIQRSKQKNIFQKRTEQKRIQEKQINNYSFKPKLNKHSHYQSYHNFYTHKQEWQTHKVEEREKKKQLNQIMQLRECTFQPQIYTQNSKFYKKNLLSNKNTKVQDRLISRFQKSLQRRIKHSQYVSQGSKSLSKIL